MKASVTLKQLGLTSEVMANLLKKEKELKRRCKTIWFFTNSKSEEFLFGSFVKNNDKDNEEVIVTLAQRINCEMIVV